MAIDVSLDDIKKLTPRFTVSVPPIPMCDHMHGDKCVCCKGATLHDLLSCKALARMFPSGAISEWCDSLDGLFFSSLFKKGHALIRLLLLSVTGPFSIVYSCFWTSGAALLYSALTCQKSNIITGFYGLTYYIPFPLYLFCIRLVQMVTTLP